MQQKILNTSKQLINIINLFCLIMLMSDSVSAQYGIEWSELNNYQKGAAITGGLIIGGAMASVAGGAVVGSSLATADFLAAVDSVAIAMADNVAVVWSALKLASRIAYTPMQKVKNFRAAQKAKNLGWEIDSWWNEFSMSRDV